MRLLEDFYYGRIRPNEQIHSNDPEYAQCVKQISECMAALQTKLSSDDFTLVEEAINLNDTLNSIASASISTKGFKMGAAIIIEVLGHSHGLIHNGSD